MYLRERLLQTEWIDYRNLETFRLSLFKTMLLIAATVSLLIAVMASAGWLPYPGHYIVSLYAYALINGVLYLFRKPLPYRLMVHVAIVSALGLFWMMLLYAHADSFRMVWFLPAVFAAYILLGRGYGYAVSFISLGIVFYGYRYFDAGISAYALFTFVAALIVFNVFVHAFLRKIEYDEEMLLERIAEEVAKQREQEALLLRRYRIAGMGEMTDAIAHQWRQPLTHSNLIAMNMLEELENIQPEYDYLRTKLDELLRLNRYMSETIDDFRTLLSDSSNCDDIVIEDAISEVIELMKYSLKDYEVKLHLGAHRMHLCRNEWIQVCIIILSNSIDAFKQRNRQYGRIDITTQTNQNSLEFPWNT